MSKDATEVVVGSNGTLWVAPYGAAEPTDIDDPLSAEWYDLGYLSEDGVTIGAPREVTSIGAWQSYYPIRRIVTSKDLTIAGALRQFGGKQVEVALDAVVTEDGTGKYRLTPNAPEDIAEWAVAIEWADGAKDYRIIVPRTILVENVEFAVARTAPTDLAVSFGVLGTDGAEAWFGQSNDPAWLYAVSS